MSSDDYFEDELDSAFLNEVDAIEAAHVSPPKAKSISTAKQPSRPRATTPDVIEIEDSDDFGDFSLDDAAFQQIDQVCADKYRELHQQGVSTVQPIAGPSKGKLTRTASKGAQMTLFGDVLPGTSTSKPPTSKRSMQRTQSSSGILRARKTKQWDHTAYAKTGWRRPKESTEKEVGKGKGKLVKNDDDEPLEFEQFPAPVFSDGPPPPMKLAVDRLAAKTWIYPLNQSRRDYQFNIVKRCLYENTLVALPTGLGKTFIAGVVMLNFYTWFPEGKVVFVAPSKPLVAQQIDACHKTCGIPGSCAAELTGSVPQTRRIDAWREKRVFYMTPQTLLNDLVNERCDPRDIVLLVFDEAHRATGEYAYVQVVRYMMAKNPHFRVLALSATPGGNGDAVQNIIDSLHISHIEIRDSLSLDIKAYVHKKIEQEHTIRMNEGIIEIKDRLAKVMQPLLAQLRTVLPGANPVKLHPFRCQGTMSDIRKNGGNNLWAMGPLAMLGSLARAMGYLLESSPNMCYGYLKTIASGTTVGNKKLQKDPNFISLLKYMETQHANGFPLHPKMETLRTLLVNHFAQHMSDKEDAGGAKSPRHTTRAMVFASFRECVDELVELLNKESPLIRATRFIGQGTDGQGKKGLLQKDQLQTIDRFKAGEFNVLVATSIGEEGLDIGEVDVAICYEAQKTPIRMLQRIGRTGRKRDGYVHILLIEEREEGNWQRAKDKQENVRTFIVRAEDLELYGDVERLLPDNFKPECVEMVMDIEEYAREDSKKDTDDSPAPKGKKRKRVDDPMRNVPTGASSGFVTVSQLLIKGGAKKRKKNDVEFDVKAGEDDDDDKEIAAGVFGPRRAVSTSALLEPSKSRKKLKKAATMANTTESKKASKAPAKKKAKQPATPSGSQFERMGTEDSDDMEIERGLRAYALEAFKPASTFMQSTPPRSRAGKVSLPSPNIPCPDDVIEITSSEGGLPSSPSNTVDTSPEQPLKSRSTSAFSGRRSVLDAVTESSNPPDQSSSPSSRGASRDNCPPDASMAWLIEDDDDPEIQLLGSSPPNPRIPSSIAAQADDDNIEFIDHSPILAPKRLRKFVDSSPPAGSSRLGSPSPSAKSPVFDTSQPSKHVTSHLKSLLKNDMPPPALPVRFTVSSPSLSDDAPPEPSFAVRAPGKQLKKRAIVDSLEFSSSPLGMSPPPQRRIQRERPPTPSPPAPRQAKRKKRKIKDIAEAQRLNPWIDVAADHSGNDSLGSSDDDQLGSDDRRFVHELPETQVSPSYDQSAVYRRSLFTQAPGGAGEGPVFVHRPARRGLDAFAVAGPSRARHRVPSSPADPDDEYDFGSFVVDDDAEISFNGDSSSEP